AGETSPEVDFEARCLVRTLGGLTPRYVGEWANQLQLTLPADTIAYIHRNTEGLPHRLSTELFWFRDWSANRG
ncbi:MAG: hypothetical protein ACRD0C_16600, partial [Acidimicrobiia bacterium]